MLRPQAERSELGREPQPDLDLLPASKHLPGALEQAIEIQVVGKLHGLLPKAHILDPVDPEEDDGVALVAPRREIPGIPPVEEPERIAPAPPPTAPGERRVQHLDRPTPTNRLLEALEERCGDPPRSVAGSDLQRSPLVGPGVVDDRSIELVPHDLDPTGQGRLALQGGSRERQTEQRVLRRGQGKMADPAAVHETVARLAADDRDPHRLEIVEIPVDGALGNAEVLDQLAQRAAPRAEVLRHLEQTGRSTHGDRGYSELPGSRGVWSRRTPAPTARN